jgi:hypothetical protein
VFLGVPLSFSTGIHPWTSKKRKVMSRENPLENKEIFNYYEIWDAIALSFLAVLDQR